MCLVFPRLSFVAVNNSVIHFVKRLSATEIVRFRNNYSTMAAEIDDYQLKLHKKAMLSVPSLSNTANYKGQAGKIGIIGGSFEYTGAPYFAAITALKVGADLVHVYCSPDAAIPIKCYSPELIVHPLLETNMFESIKESIAGLNVILLGPGLGRNLEIFALMERIIEHLKTLKKPLIIDADGLFLIAQKPELLQGFTSTVILTPNKMELARLFALSSPSQLPNLNLNALIKKHNWSDSVSILSKGQEDEVITLDKQVKFVNLGGSNRRCGGQGDVLGGALAVFLNWTRDQEDQIMVASYAACRLVRECNTSAFADKGRSMMAVDMIDKIYTVFKDSFEID